MIIEKDNIFKINRATILTGIWKWLFLCYEYLEVFIRNRKGDTIYVPLGLCPTGMEP